MTLNLAARDYQVLIYDVSGANPLDVSDVVMDLTTSDRQIDQSGLIPTTGSLTLHGYSGLAQSMDARANPTRWARGNKVEFWISNSNGVLVRHPRGAMRLLKEPSPPHLGDRTMQLELGCVLSLLDYRSPPDDKSGVTLGTATPRTAIINNLLSAAKAPALIDAVPGTIDCPMFRFDGGYIQQAGAIACAAGYVLWVDNLERVRATQVNLKNPAAFLNLVTGTDELEHTPLRDAETPCELIRVTGVGYKAKAVEEPNNDYSISRAAINTIFNVADDSETIIEINSTSYRGTTTSNPRIEQSRQQLLGLLMPDQYPNNRSLVEGDRSVSESFYEGGSSKRLKKKIETNYAMKGAVLPTYYSGNTEKIPAKRVVVKPEYAGEVTAQITTSTYEPLAIVNPGLYSDSGSGNAPKPAPETLAISQVVTQRWRRYASGWTSTTSTTNYKKTSSKGGSTGSVSGTSTTPPAPERQQESIIQEEVQLKGEARFKPRAGAAFSERQREYQVASGTVTTEAELERIAKQIGAVLIGRSQGIEWISDLRDDWLTDYEPIKRVDWQEDINIYAYLANGVSFALGERQCVVGADGIWIGTQVGTNPSPTAPYILEEAIAITSSNSFDVIDLPYALNAGTTTVAFNGKDGFDVVPVGGNGNQAIAFSSKNDFAVTIVGASGGAGGSGAIYTGNNSPRSLSTPLDEGTTDWVAIYNRFSGNLAFFNSVRGVGKFFNSIGSFEFDEADSLTAFNADGFDLGANSGFADINKSSESYIAWTLPRGDRFDVVTWTGDGVSGREIPHNLVAAPTVIMIAQTGGGASAWIIYHVDLGNNDSFEFPGGSAIAGEWNATNPTSTHFTVSGGNRVNGLDFDGIGYQYVAYLWATPAGSYVGDGNNPGILESVGTDPQRLWILSSNYDGEAYTMEWTLFDDIRNPSNPRDAAAIVYDLGTGAGETAALASVDFGGNGFTPNGNQRVNASGRTYYYWYF